jgi:hypothetical protein
MSVTQGILLGLPDKRQDRVLGWLLRAGLLFRVRAFRTLLRSLEFFGAEPTELQRAFSEAQDVGQSWSRALPLLQKLARLYIWTRFGGIFQRLNGGGCIVIRGWRRRRH